VAKQLPSLDKACELDFGGLTVRSNIVWNTHRSDRGLSWIFSVPPENYGKVP